MQFGDDTRSNASPRVFNSKFMRVACLQKFFETINPLKGFNDKDDFETYLYEQSSRIEPKEGDVPISKPRHSTDALRSPGIKTPKSATFSRAKSSSQVARSTPSGGSTPRMAPKSALTSPIQKSPPALTSSGGGGVGGLVGGSGVPTPPTSAGTGGGEESPFALVSFSTSSPSGSGSGRINAAFSAEYAMMGDDAGCSPARSPVAPAATPGGALRFNFPLPSSASPAAFPLSQPPRRRHADRDRSSGGGGNATGAKSAAASHGVLPNATAVVALLSSPATAKRTPPPLPPNSPPFVPRSAVSPSSHAAPRKSRARAHAA